MKKNTYGGRLNTLEEKEVYHELHRPQFHFTAKKDWINDPNGLVYYKGEYHLFFQHSPGFISHAPNTWGHAKSLDLVHWKQINHATNQLHGVWIHGLGFACE